MGSRLGPGRNPGAYFDRADIEAQALVSDGRGGMIAPSYLSLPGTAGNYASTPDAAALNVGGDLDVRFDGDLDDWTPAATTALVAKYGNFGAIGGYQLVLLSTGVLRLVWGDTNGITRTADSTVATGATGRAEVRAKLDLDTGSGSYAVTFYVEDTQLGATVAGGTTNPIRSNTAPLTIGATPADTAHAAGKVYGARVYDGGTLVFDADFSALREGSTKLTEDASGATVTVSQSGDDPAEVVATDPWAAITDGSDIPVDLRALEGMERIRAMQTQADVTHEVETSVFVEGVTASHRLKITSDGDRILNIVSAPVVVGRKRRLMLLCSEDTD